MPDWLMILKMGLWIMVGHFGYMLLFQLRKPTHDVHWLNILIPIVAAVILAALEGWITP